MQSSLLMTNLGVAYLVDLVEAGFVGHRHPSQNALSCLRLETLKRVVRNEAGVESQLFVACCFAMAIKKNYSVRRIVEVPLIAIVDLYDYVCVVRLRAIAQVNGARRVIARGGDGSHCQSQIAAVTGTAFQNLARRLELPRWFIVVELARDIFTNCVNSSLVGLQFGC